MSEKQDPEKIVREIKRKTTRNTLVQVDQETGFRAPGLRFFAYLGILANTNVVMN